MSDKPLPVDEETATQIAAIRAAWAIFEGFIAGTVAAEPMYPREDRPMTSHSSDARNKEDGTCANS